MCVCVRACMRVLVCMCVGVHVCKVYMCVQLYPVSTSPLKTTIAHPRECHVPFLSRLCKVATLPVVASRPTPGMVSPTTRWRRLRRRRQRLRQWEKFLEEDGAAEDKELGTGQTATRNRATCAQLYHGVFILHMNPTEILSLFASLYLRCVET